MIHIPSSELAGSPCRKINAERNHSAGLCGNELMESGTNRGAGTSMLPFLAAVVHRRSFQETSG